MPKRMLSLTRRCGNSDASCGTYAIGLVSGGEYDLVVSTNPAMPEICAEVGNSFPDQKFIIQDAYQPGNPAIATYFFNQYEQSVYLGYLAALISEEGVKAGKNKRRLGYVLAQEFPVADKLMVPGFLDGARMVNPEYKLDLRIVGNWYDASKAAELAGSMIDAGAGVLTHIAGGAGQGAVNTARERGAVMVAYDNNQYADAPGTILGCGQLGLGRLTEEVILKAVKGNVPYGEAAVLGLKEGYLDFIFDDPGYRDYLPQDIRDKFETFFEKLKSGEIPINTPPGIF